MPAATLAGALALAGCGGSDKPAGGSPETPPKCGPGTMLNDAKDGCDASPTSMSDIAKAEDMATKAMEAADAAFEKAKGASNDVSMKDGHKTGFADVQGKSADAAANAQAILDAEAEINKALEDAKKALEDAKALPEDAAGRARLVKSIEMEIEMIEKNQKTVKDRADDIRVRKAKPRDAAYWGTQAAEGLNTALITSVKTRTGNPSDLAMAIAGGKALFVGDTRLDGARNFMNEPLKGEKLTGGMLDKAGPGTSVQATSSGPNIAGLPMVDTAHFVCVSADGCAAVKTGEEIGDGWYFTDKGATKNRWYVKNKAGDAYEQAKYLEWGVWFDASDAVKSFAGQGHGSDSFTTSANRGEIGVDDDLPGTATYEGDAHGLSTFRASKDGGPFKAVRSGHFTADVKLEATFGNEPKLEGMIGNFQGDAVNTGWKVEIKEGNLATSGMGELNDEVDDGRFTYETYGEAKQRPTGIVGTFGKNFSDGAVDGVYHAD